MSAAPLIMPGPDWVHFDALAGVPVSWLGRRGFRWLEPHFHAQLTAALEEIWSLCPYGRASSIVSAGAYVMRVAEPGDRHATGTAFDLVGIEWEDHPVLHASLAELDARRYLAVESSLRRHCPQVLDWWSNEAHHDHWHIDDRSEAAGYSSKSKADVCFAQAVLFHVFCRWEVAIDGDEGPITRRVLGEEMEGRSWGEWLLDVARKSWGA